MPHRVVIAGGGVAGLEALIALHELAGELVDVTLLAPAERYTTRALSVKQPFALASPSEYDLATIAADNGATFHRDAVHAVHRETHTVQTESGEELTYDSLLVAVGARPSPAFTGANTFRGAQDAETVHGLVQDIEGEYTTSVAFVVPPGATWPLPIYELALMTAERAESLGVSVQLTIVTPEPAPLAIFGGEVSHQVAALLDQHGIAVRTHAQVQSVEGGVVKAAPGAIEVRAGRVIALPRLNGPRIEGLPSDPEGFLPVDDHGLVRGCTDIFGAGDGTTQPIKQGGIAAQQAGVAAQAIASRAGAEVSQHPFRPVLRAELLTGAHSLFLRQLATGGYGDSASQTSDQALWWPPAKVVAPYLTQYLENTPAAARSRPG